MRAESWALYGRDPWEMSRPELEVAISGFAPDGPFAAALRSHAPELIDPKWWKGEMERRLAAGRGMTVEALSKMG